MYQVGPACYATPSAAASASASQSVGSIVSQGSTLYVVDVSSVSGTSITYDLYPVAGGSPITVTSPYLAQPCGLLTAADGADLGWKVAAVWLVVFAVLFITRGLRGDA